MKDSKKSKKLVVILMGPPGSGKGTQAELLSEKLNLYYLETSKILEKSFMTTRKKDFIVVDRKKYYSADEKRLWQTGMLCSPPFVTHLIERKIKELFKDGRNLVLAGSPRTLYEGEKVIPFLRKLYKKENIFVFLLKLSEKESIWRNSHRRICSLMRHPILYTKETKKLTRCPLDGSKLMKRKGLDEPETIKIRFREYKKRTFPLINYFRKQKLRVKKVNGEQPVADVFEDVLKKLI